MRRPPSFLADFSLGLFIFAAVALIVWVVSTVYEPTVQIGPEPIREGVSE
jgi:hypothetical protein